MKKIKFNTDRILGITAMMVGILTLIIFIYQTNIIRKQSRLSVTPRLTFHTGQKNRDSVIIFSEDLINKGLGPAIIEEIYIVHKGKKYDLDFPNFFAEAFPKIDEYGSLTNNMTINKGNTLSPNEINNLYTFKTTKSQFQDLKNYLNFNEGKSAFRLEVIYTSIYQEQWKINNNDSGHPTKL